MYFPLACLQTKTENEEKDQMLKPPSHNKTF